jgi:hypothetical protein
MEPMLWELRPPPPPPPPPPPLAKASLLMDNEAAVMAKAATVAVRMDFMFVSDPWRAIIAADDRDRRDAIAHTR